MDESDLQGRYGRYSDGDRSCDKSGFLLFSTPRPPPATGNASLSIRCGLFLLLIALKGKVSTGRSDRPGSLGMIFNQFWGRTAIRTRSDIAPWRLRVWKPPESDSVRPSSFHSRRTKCWNRINKRSDTFPPFDGPPAESKLSGVARIASWQ